ncbi:MAG TPA: DNA helicase II [Coxiellaceae bacterium]|nr:DNA helicase II [Coxiellaceae bacterium]
MNPNFLSDLNSAQHQAVTFTGGNLLVLAGAGSGKTRVLVHRIAWLLSQGASPQNILAVTFTNKAATQMRIRLEQMLQFSLASMWVGTFHGLAHRLLRLHWQEAGLVQSFQILDADDQTRLLKRIHKALSLDPEKWPVKQSQAFINGNKEKGLRYSEAATNGFVDPVLIRVYQAYENACSSSGLVDFAELLLRSYELWQNNQQLREQYQKRFGHILVDEFQDTNAIQYAWIKSVSSSDSNLTAVGDDDQSIYSWRGADSNNMQRLKSDYANVNVVRLEQNYRSTATILKAANAIITNNKSRLGKNLWTNCGDGDPIILYAAFNEIDEARYVVDKIQLWRKQGKALNEAAILYRSNAQSRVIEEQLLRAGIPYRVYGGMRFFERAEIKDVLAYLRLLVNRNDDAAFERVINLPTRGLGEAALVLLRNHARLHNCSLWKAGETMVATQQLPARATSALSGFMSLINDGSMQIAKLTLAELVQFIINLVGLHEHYSKPQYQEYKQSRLENLDELINAAGQFSTLVSEDDCQLLLNAFLAHVALEAGEHLDKDDSNNCVQLMTLHAAKGLEFSLVFLCGMEEGLFPHIMSMGSKEELEEERRLCYVGMTRAKQKLYMSCADSRQLHGSTNLRQPSRFLREIPPELIKSDTLINSVKPALFEDLSQDLSHGQDVSQGNDFYLGQNVSHQEFGEGVITSFEGHGEHTWVRVKFRKVGSKLLSPEYIRGRVI